MSNHIHGSKRDGADLLMALPLNFADLTLGATIEIPHIDSDDLRIAIPPGSNPGETISIPGRVCHTIIKDREGAQ